MLLYVVICCYMLLYVVICGYMLLLLLYVVICCYMLLLVGLVLPEKWSKDASEFRPSPV